LLIARTSSDVVVIFGYIGDVHFSNLGAGQPSYP